ncbi:MAG: lysophospholipid acyltransferase family protein [Ignavibacteria bacterium]
MSIGFSLKKIYEKLSKNEIVCFLTDQSAHPDYSVYVNFLERKYRLFPGPAKIALKLRPVLIFGYGIRQKDYTYDIMFENINYDDLEESSEANIRILSQRISDCMEKIIRENSGQWLWFHKRFKHMKT